MLETGGWADNDDKSRIGCSDMLLERMFLYCGFVQNILLCDLKESWFLEVRQNMKEGSMALRLNLKFELILGDLVLDIFMC